MATALSVARSSSPTAHTTTATEPTPRKFRPDIEGLRAVAVVMVLLDHAGLAILGGGYVGVDVFFVLSGFLITSLLLKEVSETGGVSLPKFYARRARRLLPAGALVLVTTVLASYAVFGISRANRVAEDAQWSALFASNFRFIQQGTDYLGAQEPPSPLQHFWSLAVEEQFYFVWPLLIVLVATVGKRVSTRLKLGVVLTALIAVSLVISTRMTATDATEAYFSPFPRASELAAGALLAVAAPWLLRVPRSLGVAMSWIGIGVVVAAGFLFDEATTFPGTLVMIPVVGTMLAVAGGTIAPATGAEVLLAQKPFQWLGKLSYSLYLWHWPILILAAGWAGRELSVTENLLLCLLAVGVSAVTFHVIEDPVRASSLLAKRPPLVSVGVGAALVVMSVAAASTMLSLHPQQGEITSESVQVSEIPSENEVLQAVAAGAHQDQWPTQPPRIRNLAYSGDCDVTRLDTTSAACVFGDPNAQRTVVMFGDSHGAMWIPALDEIGQRNGWRVIQLTKPGCPVPDFPNYSKSLKREYTECAGFRDFAISKIAEIQPDVVLLSSARKGVILSDGGDPTEDGLEEAWSAGLGSVIDEVSPNTGRVVLIGDMAYPEEGGIDCLTANPGNASACATPIGDAVFADHNAMERQVAQDHGADYVDIVPWLCTDTTCPAVINNLTVRRDAHHVAENYSVWLSGVLAEATGLEPDPNAPSSGPNPATPDSTSLWIPGAWDAQRRPGS